jgi:hypothetical protein
MKGEDEVEVEVEMRRDGDLRFAAAAATRPTAKEDRAEARKSEPRVTIDIFFPDQTSIDLMI